MTHEWVGVKLVAVVALRWSGTVIDPGDVFELEPADLEVSGVDPAFWLKCGAAERFVEPTAPEPPGGAQERRARGGATGVRHTQGTAAPAAPGADDEAVSDG